MINQAELERIKSLAEKATEGPLSCVRFTRPDGKPIETVEDVAETTASSARHGSIAELWGVAIPVGDDNQVVCYTGNGPTSRRNAEFRPRMIRATPIDDELRLLRALASGSIIAWRATPTQRRLRSFRWIETERVRTGIRLTLTTGGRQALFTNGGL
jgi:hypothetical protein